MTVNFSTKKLTSNDQEGAPRMLKGRLLAIYPLPNVVGSAANRSTFFLLNGVVVVGDMDRALTPPPIHAEQPGRMTADFSLFLKY